MTIEYGLTLDGLVIKSLQVIRDDLDAAMRNAFGSSLALGDLSFFGQFDGILADRFAAVWDLLQAIDSSQDPDKATGAALEALCVLTGTFRPAPSYSVVTLGIVGVDGTLLSSGTFKASTLSTKKQFVTTADVTIQTCPAWTATTAYLLNTLVTNASRVYQCITAGTSSTPGPSSTGPTITDGTVQWAYLGEGTAAVLAPTRCTETGPISAFSRDLAEIGTPASGVVAVVNAYDAVPGRGITSDESLRLLRESELSGNGGGTLKSIRALLSKIPNITSVTVFQNNTDLTNADGMPPHTVEALVRAPWVAGDPLDQQIYDALLARVAGGIRTIGNQSGTAVDEAGNAQPENYSRPAEIRIYTKLTVIYQAGVYPANGDELIREAIAAAGSARETGFDAVSAFAASRAWTIPGVLDVPTCFISTSPAPTLPTTIAIGTRQIATWDSGDVIVLSTPGTP